MSDRPTNRIEGLTGPLDRDPREIEQRLAEAILSALKNSDPTAYIQGDIESKRTTIDGVFNLEAVVKLVAYDLNDLFRRR